jgi:hypothetical protein
VSFSFLFFFSLLSARPFPLFPQEFKGGLSGSVGSMGSVAEAEGGIEVEALRAYWAEEERPDLASLRVLGDLKVLWVLFVCFCS